MFVVDHPDGDFSPLPRNAGGWTDPLVVYRRKGRAVRSAVVFVHGLGGDSNKTWGRYPEFVFQSHMNADVGLFDYESGARRRPWRSVSISRQANALAHYVRDFSYDNVVLVGHSMGGLLCKTAIKNLLDSGTHDALGARGIDKVAGLVLFATPQYGSRRVPVLFASLSKDGRALRVGSALAQDAAQRFQDRVVTSMNHITSNSHDHTRQRLPTFAVIAHGDFWVDHLSAGLGLESDQQKIVAGSHRSIVKPASETDDAYMWFRDQVGRCLDPPWSRGATPSLAARGAADVDLRLIRRSIVDAARRSGLNSTMHINITITKADLGADMPDGGPHGNA